MTKLVLISGVSRSGKSTLAKKLHNDLPNAKVIHQDEYALPIDQLPRVKDRIDWERPETIDWERLKKKITKEQLSTSYLILEGIFALSDLDLASSADYIISLEIDKANFLERRKLETRWGTEPGWFLEHVWESHIKFQNPHQVNTNVITGDLSDIDYASTLSKIRLL